MTIKVHCKNTYYILQPNNHIGYIENNAIVRVPRPGPYSLYIYFLHAHPIYCLIN